MDRFLEFIVNHWELSTTFLALIVALIIVEKKRAGATLSPQQVTFMLNKDAAVLVDVREKKDFSEGHIKGSLHMPMSTLKERKAELDKHKDKQIIVVDKMGQHSGMACKTLKEIGVENAARLSGGIAERHGQNLPVAKK